MLLPFQPKLSCSNGDSFKLMTWISWCHSCAKEEHCDLILVQEETWNEAGYQTVVILHKIRNGPRSRYSAAMIIQQNRLNPPDEQLEQFLTVREPPGRKESYVQDFCCSADTFNSLQVFLTFREQPWQSWGQQSLSGCIFSKNWIDGRLTTEATGSI